MSDWNAVTPRELTYGNFEGMSVMADGLTVHVTDPNLYVELGGNSDHEKLVIYHGPSEDEPDKLVVPVDSIFSITEHEDEKRFAIHRANSTIYLEW